MGMLLIVTTHTKILALKKDTASIFPSSIPEDIIFESRRIPRSPTVVTMLQVVFSHNYRWYTFCPTFCLWARGFTMVGG